MVVEAALRRRGSLVEAATGYVRDITLSARDAFVFPEPINSATDVQSAYAAWLPDAVSRLRELVNLERDWDADGGLAVDVDVARSALLLLVSSATRVDTPPQLVPVGDGGVMLEWHTLDGDLEVDIGPGFRGSIYFRDRVRGRELESSELRSLGVHVPFLAAMLERNA